MDVIRVQDAPRYQATDPVLLEWAATEERILLTHDVQTMTKFAYDRIRAGQPMPGVIEVCDGVSTEQAIEEILLALSVSLPGELANRITYIPLQVFARQQRLRHLHQPVPCHRAGLRRARWLLVGQQSTLRR